MPNTTTRRQRSSRTTRATPARATSPRRRRTHGRPATSQRRGLAGGWLQRRQPEPTGLQKATKTLATTFSRRGSKLAATGLGLLTAGGIAQYMRGKKASQRDASSPDISERPGTNDVPPTA